MKTFARFLLAIATATTCSQLSEARYRLFTPTEMIQSSELIAVVEIASVEKAETAGSYGPYTQRAQAKIEQIIKGSAEKSITLVGQLKQPRCVPDWVLQTGRQLIFVRKTPAGDYISANAGLGLIPIRNDKVSWFADMSNSNKGVDLSLAKALNSIKANLSPSSTK